MDSGRYENSLKTRRIFDRSTPLEYNPEQAAQHERRVGYLPHVDGLHALAIVSVVGYTPGVARGDDRVRQESSSALLSNIHFYGTTDYFALEAQERPLLHTWSLSIEEQFYLIWPLVLLLLVTRLLRKTAIMSAPSS